METLSSLNIILFRTFCFQIDQRYESHWFFEDSMEIDISTQNPSDCRIWMQKVQKEALLNEPQAFMN